MLIYRATYRIDKSGHETDLVVDRDQPSPIDGFAVEKTTSHQGHYLEEGTVFVDLEQARSFAGHDLDAKVRPILKGRRLGDAIDAESEECPGCLVTLPVTHLVRLAALADEIGCSQIELLDRLLCSAERMRDGQ